MEASALPAPAAIARSRLSIGSSLLRLRSDEQLVALFRAGNEDAFRVIHERYHQRLFAYARQMLPGSKQDAEDALQDIFVRAYAGLRATDRALALRAWLYRVAHNRCVDELRRPTPPSPELLEVVRPPAHDPIAEAERRESLRSLIEDIRRLPDQQRSALLMRELGGMAYSDLAHALGVSVPAVKSLLVRARIGLAQSAEARDTACFEIREQLVIAYDRGVRPSGLVRRHLQECEHCRAFREEMRSTSRKVAAIVPLGPLGLMANLFGFGGGAAGGGSAAVVGTGGAVGAIGAVAGGAATHVAIIAAAVVTAGGAVEIQHTISASSTHPDPALAPAALRSPEPFVPGEAGFAPSPAPLAPTAWPAAAGPLQALAMTASQVAAVTAAIAGPALPAADQVNPADVAAAASPSLSAPAPVSTASTPASTSPPPAISAPGGSQTSSSTGTGTGSSGTGTGTGTGSGAAAAPGSSTGSSTDSSSSTGSTGTTATTTTSSSSTDEKTANGTVATPASASGSGSGTSAGSASSPPPPPPPPPQAPQN